MKPGDVATFDAVTLVHGVARPTYATIPQYRAVLQPSFSYIVGDHDVKLGYQFNRGWQNPQNYSFSNFPAGLQAVFRNGVPDSVNTYNTPTANPLSLNEQGVYAQDTWKPTRKLTIGGGLRMQKATQQLTNNSNIVRVRRDIARVKTLLNQKAGQA